MEKEQTKQGKNKPLFSCNPEKITEICTSEDYKEASHEKISKMSEIINRLVKKAQGLYNKGDFVASAKVFRQLGRVTRNLESAIEEKGNYHPRNQLNDLTGKEWLKHSKSWLVVDGKPSDIPKEIKNHPASYPPDLAKHFIRFFTKKNECVFDPFMGIGSTLVAAKLLDRNCWGTELKEEYANYAISRIASFQATLDSYVPEDQQETPEKKEAPKGHSTGNTYHHVFSADARDAARLWELNNIAKTKLIVTSPPYWDMLSKSRGGVKSSLKQRVEQGFDEKYSEKQQDLGNITGYELYLQEIKDIFQSFQKFLTPGAHIVVIVQNVRTKEGIMKPLAWDLGTSLGEIYHLRQEYIWCQDQKFMGIWGYPTTYVSNVHHHYCLVLQNSGTLPK